MRQSLESVMSVYDNTTAISVKIIGVKKGRKKKLSLGDQALVVPKKFYVSKEIQKRKKYLALIIGLKRKIQRLNGTCLTSLDNKVLLFTYTYKFLGSRVYGGICKEIRGGPVEALFKKVIGYSSGSF